MPRVLNNPKICPKCDHIWQSTRRVTRIKGKRRTYIEVVHVDTLSRLGLKEGVCNDCE